MKNSTRNSTRSTLRILSVLALALVFLPPAAHATSAIWTGGAADGLWATSGNWSGAPATVPGTGDTATFNAAAGGGGAVLDLGAGVTITAVSFNTPSVAAYTIGAGAVGSQTLTLADSGTISADAAIGQSQLFNSALTLGTATAASYTITDNSSAKSLTFAGNITGGTGGTGAAKTLTVNTVLGGVTISGIIDKGGATSLALTKQGTGVLTLTGPNTYIGTTTISAGVLNAGVVDTAGVSGPLGASGNIVFGGGALQFSAASAAWDPSPRIATGTSGSAVAIDTAGHNVTFGTALAATQTGGLQKMGAGTLTITKANLNTGATTIWAGTLSIDAGAGGALPNVALTFNVGSTPYTVSAGSPTFNYDNTTALVPKSLSLAALTFTAGEGTVQLTRTALQTASLTFSSMAARAAGAVRNFVYAGTPGTIGTDSKITPTGAAAGFMDQASFVGGTAYAFMNGASPSYVRAYTTGDANYFSVAGGMTMGSPAATDNVALSGDITAQTTATVNTINLGASSITMNSTADTLQTDGLLSSGAAAATVGSTGGVLQPKTSAGELNIRVNGSSDNLTIGSIIQNQNNNTAAAGAAALNKSGAGTLSLSGVNTISGATYVNAGTLNLQNQRALQSSTLTMRGGTVVFDSSVSGNAFTLGSLAAGFAQGVGIALQNNAGSPAPIALSAGNNNANTTYGGILSGPGSLTKIGTGTLTLSGLSTYTGKTTVAAGTLTANAAPSSAGVAGPLGAPTGSDATIDVLASGKIVFNPGYQGLFALSRPINLGGGAGVAGTGVASVSFQQNDTIFTVNSPITAIGTGLKTFAIGTGNGNNGDREAVVFNSSIPNVSDGSPLSLTVNFATQSGAGSYVSLNAGGTFTGPITLVRGNANPGFLTIGGVFHNSNAGNANTVGSGQLNSGSYSGAISLDTLTTLNYLSSANQTLSGFISGLGGLTQSGTGSTLTLSGANNYSGDTALVAGTLLLGNQFALRNSALNYTGGTHQFGGGSTAYQFGGLKGTANLGLANLSSAGVALTLLCPPGTTSTYSGNLDDLGSGGSLTKTGGGVQALNGTDTYTGNTLIQAGALSIGGTGSLPGWNVAGRFTVANNAALAVGNGVADADVDTLLATGNFAAGASLGYDTTVGNRARTTALGDTGAGALGLLKIGANTLTLSAANSYTGPTVVTGGTLQLGVFDAITNNGPVTVAGGIYNLGGFANVTNGVVTMTSGSIVNGTLYASSFNSLGGTNGANVAGPGAFTINTGATTINNINTFTGGLVLNGGTLTLDFANAPTDLVNNANVLTLGGGTLVLKGLGSATDSQTFASTTMSANRGSTVTLTQNGASSLTLNLGLITRNTGSTVNFSVVPLTTGVIATTSTANEASGILGPWVTVGATTLLQYGTVNGSSQIISYAGATTTTQPANLSDVINAGANYAYGATPSPTLTVPITANTLRVTGAAGTLTTAGNSITLNGLMNAGSGALTIGTSAGPNGNLVIGANKELVILANAQATTISPLIVDNGGGASSLTYSGAATLNINNNANAYTGGTTINSGTLAFGVAGSGTITDTPLGTGPVTVNSGATLALSRTYLANNLTLNNATVTAGNSFTSILPAGSTITLNGISAINVSGNLSIFGDMTGPGGFTKGLGATVPVTGNNNYTGPTIINVGSLLFAKPASLYNADSLQWIPANITVASGAILRLNVGGASDFTPAQVGTILGNLTTGLNTNGLKAGSFLGINTANAGGTVTLAADITDSTGVGSGSVGFVVYGAGTVELTGVNTYTGPTIVDNNAALLVSTFNSVNGGLPPLASSTLGRPTSIANGTILLGTSTSFQGGRLTYVGTGETTDRVISLGGANNTTYVIDQSGSGLLKFTSPVALGADNRGPKTIVLQGSTASTGEIAGAIPVMNSAVGSETRLTKSGTGTWTLSANNLYTGVTTVSGGTLLVNGSTAAASAVTVNAGGTLAGTGTINGTVTVQSGGTLGGSGTINGTVTVNAGGTTLLGASGATLTLANVTAPSYASTCTLEILASASTLDKISAPNATTGNSVANVALLIDTTGLSVNVPSTVIYSAGGAITGPFASVTVIGNTAYAATIDYSTSGQIKLALSLPSPTTASISPPNILTGDVTIDFDTVVGFCYKVQYTDVLPVPPGTWIDLGATIQATGITMSVTDPGAALTYPQRFYRVVQVLVPCP